MVEGEQFLIQSPSPDWVRRKILLSDLRDSAVNLILKEGNTSQKSPMKSTTITPNSTVLGQQWDRLQ
jgi:hypothetical protein